MKLKIVLIILLASLAIQSSYAQKLFPTPNQNVKDAYSLASSLYKTNKRKLNFENNISSIVKISSSIQDPKQLVREYKAKMQQLQDEADERTEQRMRELDKQIDLLENAMKAALREIDRNAASSPLLQIAAAGAKIAAKNNARKKIDAAKRDAQNELDREMKSAMGKIYDKVVKDNKKAQKEYLVAAAKVFSEREETYYVDNYYFHSCVLKEMKKNYSYKSATWMNTGCSAPSKIYGGYQTAPKLRYTSSSGSKYQPLLDVAYRKLKLYRTKMPYKEFYESAMEYAEAELAENNTNGNAYIFLADLTDDITKKYQLTGYALALNKNDVTTKKKFNEAKEKFGKKLFASIASNKNSFVIDANSKGLLKGFSHDNKTAFDFAVEKDNAKIMELLMPAGTNKFNLIYSVIEAGGINIANALLNEVDLSKAPRLKGYDLLTAAVHFNRKSVTTNLLNKEFNYLRSFKLAKVKSKTLHAKLNTALIDYAFAKNDVEMFENVIKRTPKLITPTDPSGDNVVDRVIKKNKKDLLPILVKYGLDVKQPTYSYLLELAIKSTAETVGLNLVGYGIDVNHQPEVGGSLINLMAEKKGMNGLFDQLLAKGVSVAAFNNKDEFPVMTAMRTNESYKVTQLIKKNSPISFSSKLGGNQMHWIIENAIHHDYIKQMAENNIDVDGGDGNGDTPLMFALKKKKSSYVLSLVKLGADANVLNNENITPLQFAVYGAPDLFKFLVPNSKNVNLRGAKGWTALHFAAKEGNLEATRLLLNANADVTMFDETGFTPYRIARLAKNIEVKKALAKKMGMITIIKRSYLHYKLFDSKKVTTASTPTTVGAKVG